MHALLDAYAFLHIFIAHAADGELSGDEVAVTTHNVHRMARTVGFDALASADLVHGALDRYAETLMEEGPSAVATAYHDAVQQVLAAAGDHPGARRLIEADLIAMADADGHVDAMERLLIDQVLSRWNQHHV